MLVASLSTGARAVASWFVAAPAAVEISLMAAPERAVLGLDLRHRRCVDAA